MENNRDNAQEQPAQLTASEMLRTQIRPEPSIVSQSTPATPIAPYPEPTSPEQPPLYNRAKAARITDCLRELLDPAYILLFGTLAGGTPHSETNTYDLLIITDGKSYYNWYDVKRYLKTKLPDVGHGAPYVNVYVLSKHEVEANFTPFVYLSRREGILLFRNQKFTRPRRTFEFGHAAAVARKYADTFLPLADQLTDYAERTLDWNTVRQAAFMTAQAAVYYFRTIFYVYHGFEADTYDVAILQHRMRTLSGELMLLFEGGKADELHTLACLNIFLVNARYKPDFFIYPAELRCHLGIVKQFGVVANRLCRNRIGLYNSRTEA